MTEAFDIVRAGYDAIGPRYHEWSHASPVRRQWVQRLLSELPDDSLVLELGSPLTWPDRNVNSPVR